MSMNLSRIQRWQMQKLADKVDRVTQADKHFFERFPDRRHRVRIASQAEIEQFGIVKGYIDTTPPNGFEHYIVVKCVKAGFRLRRPLTSHAGNDTDVSETEAAWLYDSCLSNRDRALEADMARAVEARG